MFGRELRVSLQRTREILGHHASLGDAVHRLRTVMPLARQEKIRHQVTEKSRHRKRQDDPRDNEHTVRREKHHHPAGNAFALPLLAQPPPCAGTHRQARHPEQQPDHATILARPAPLRKIFRLHPAPRFAAVSHLMRIRAFQGLIPRVDLAAELASPPYDVLDTAEARQIIAAQPRSFLRAVRAEATLPEGTDAYSPAVYEQARRNFEQMQKDGELVRESAPQIYLYRQIMGDHSQMGLTAVCHADDYAAGLIKKHEKTRPEKEDDRVRLNTALSAHIEPVFLAFDSTPEIDALIQAAAQTTPLYDFTAPDGIRHTFWRMPDADAVTRAFAAVPHTYIADGHHRSAGAARVGLARREANPQHTGEEDYNWFPAVLFPQDQLKILAYNRLVVDLNGLHPEEFLVRVGHACKLTPAAPAVPAQPGQVSMYLGGHWLGLEFDLPAGADPVSRLDVSLLQDRVLAPILGIDDPRTSKRIDFVGGIRGTDYLRQQVDARRAAVAFSMHPVTMRQLMDIADAGQIMPPKSTWFEPKLRSGLFIHTF